jgi:putative addiction module killer protein
MREVFGPGWRMYYIKFGDTILVMLAGGGKGSQQGDISRAKLLAQKFKESSK